MLWVFPIWHHISLGVLELFMQSERSVTPHSKSPRGFRNLCSSYISQLSYSINIAVFGKSGVHITPAMIFTYGTKQLCNQ
jgi:hypothetical protein